MQENVSNQEREQERYGLVGVTLCTGILKVRALITKEDWKLLCDTKRGEIHAETGEKYVYIF